MEKDFHVKLKIVVRNYLKNKNFSVKEEFPIKNLKIDVVGWKGKRKILFECEIPSKYKEFLELKKRVDHKTLRSLFSPLTFVSKCMRKVSNIFERTDSLPVLVIPNDYFPDILKETIPSKGIETWFVNIKNLEISLKENPKGEFILKKEEKKRSLIDYILHYFNSKYPLGAARAKTRKVVERFKKDADTVKRIADYYENGYIEKVEEEIESLSRI